MKNAPKKIALVSVLAFSLLACNKVDRTEPSGTLSQTGDAIAEAAMDSVSYAAKQEIRDKKFVKTADINMEVKDVYDATVFIEGKLRALGGFVTESRLQSNVVSEEEYETSDMDAVLVKKFQTDNKMQVRVPSENLSDFLTAINDKKLFLNTRIILAEDVTDQAKIAALEAQKLQKTGQVISKMKNTGDKVDRTSTNEEEQKQQKIQNIKLADSLRYSTVEIYIKEPKLRIAEIAVTNSKNIDNKYKFNFFYDAKNAFVEGFYLVQRLLVGLIMLWPVLLAGALVFYLTKRRKSTNKPSAGE